MPIQLQITMANSALASSPFPNRIPTNQPYGPRRPTRNAGRREQAVIAAEARRNSAYKIAFDGVPTAFEHPLFAVGGHSLPAGLAAG